MIQNRRSPRSEPLPDSTQGRRHELVRLKAGLCLAERARPRAQQSPSGLTRWIFTDISVALDAAAPEDRRAPLNKHESEWCTLLVLRSLEHTEFTAPPTRACRFPNDVRTDRRFVPTANRIGC